MNQPIPIRKNVKKAERKPTYTQLLLDALKAGETFTGPDAYERWGVWAVSSLISGLRANGWKIDTDYEARTGRAIYSLTSKRQRKGMKYYPSLGVFV